MSRPLSNAQIDRLGERLIARDRPAESDLQLLHRLLASSGEVLDAAVERVRSELSLSPSFRLKNTGSILEKLRRQGSSGLRNMQDLAGMRIIGDWTLSEQDAIAAALVEQFSDETRRPKIVDRREHPSFGYRAVHVVVFPDQFPIEIQLRTRWQHEWADMFEKLADRLGRGIRYGGPPTPIAGAPGAAEAIVETAGRTSDLIHGIELESAAGESTESVERAELRAAVDEVLRQLGEMPRLFPV